MQMQSAEFSELKRRGHRDRGETQRGLVEMQNAECRVQNSPKAEKKVHAKAQRRKGSSNRRERRKQREEKEFLTTNGR